MTMRALLFAALLVPSALEATTWVYHSPAAALIHDIAASPESETVFAATSGGLFRSADDGDTWEHVAALSRGRFRHVIVDPHDSRYVYAAGNAGAFRSTDGGMTWTACGALPGIAWVFEIDPSEPSILWAGVSSIGAHRSSDRCQTWTPVQTDLSIGSLHLAVHPSNGTVYASRLGGSPYMTKDGGVTWTAMPRPTGEVPMQTTSMFAHPGGLILDTNYGLFETANEGESWTQLEPPPSFAFISSYALDPVSRIVYVATTQGIFRREDGEPGWAQVGDGTFEESINVLKIFSDGQNVTLIGGTAGRGFFRSSDGGMTWVAPADPIEASSIDAIAVAPRPWPVVFAGTSSGLFRSWNRGRTWSLVGLPHHSIRFIIIERDSILVATGSDGVLRSRDGGSTWRRLDGPIPGLPRTMVADPRDPKRLVVGAVDGLFISEDGESWRQANTVDPANAVAFDLTDPNVILYARGSEIWRSADGGFAFTKFATPATGTIISLMNDPYDPNRIYAGTATKGLWVSDDRGATWTLLDERITSAFSFVFLSPTEAYVASALNGIYKSMDGGDHWDLFADPQVHYQIQSMAVEPRSNELWLGTSAGAFRSTTLVRRRSVRR